MRFAIACIHGWAHSQLNVPLERWQQAFVIGVITIAPLVCLPFLWTRFRRQAAGFATCCLAAGLVFGLYFHFVQDSPDHVAHVAHGPARTLFVSTAALLIVIESAGMLICARMWWRLRPGRQVSVVA
ncbi:MAG: hypothetical protein ABI823_09345 [Bryobacteraceae bacterium]